jgi:segregation and condensation protein A
MDTFQVRAPTFEGPLDLLLHLIETREMDITTVSLAAIADQYLKYLTRPGAVELSQLADYLLIAARLILIKSRLLLPHTESDALTEETDAAEELARQLREYKMFKSIAGGLRERETQGLHAYARFAPPPRPDLPPRQVAGLNLDALIAALHRAFSVPEPLATRDAVVPFTVSLQEKIATILDLTTRRSRVRFSRLIQGVTSRVQVIVTFLAILELVKQRRVDAQQEKIFGDILLIKRDTPPPTPPVTEPDSVGV